VSTRERIWFFELPELLTRFVVDTDVNTPGRYHNHPEFATLGIDRGVNVYAVLESVHTENENLPDNADLGGNQNLASLKAHSKE